MSDIDWGHRKPLKWGEPGDYVQDEKEKISKVVKQMKKSGFFSGKDEEGLLGNYKKLMDGETIEISGITYGTHKDGCKSPMGLLKDSGVNDVLKASYLLDKLITLI